MRVTGTVALARTSNTPGRTQELNIFEAEDAPLRIVDMPGYGFAQAPKDKVGDVDQADPRLPHRPPEPPPRLRAGRRPARAQGQRPHGDERTRQAPR